MGILLANWLISKQGELKKYDGLDLIGLGLMAASAIQQIGVVMAGGGQQFGWKSVQIPKELLGALFFLLSFVWLWRLEREYRTFTWYRYRRTQARSGFIYGAYHFLFGCVVIGLSLVPKLDLVNLLTGVGLTLIGVFFIYWRSGRTITHDVKSLIRKS